MENEADDCVTVESSKPFRGLAVDEMVLKRMENVEGRRVPQVRTKQNADEFYY